MIRMKKGPTECNAPWVAILEAPSSDTEGRDAETIANNAISIALAWVDGAPAWHGWEFIR